MSMGTLFVIAAPSGGGKTSLVNALLKSMDHIKVSVSHTTRNQRPGEAQHINYHFVDKAEFDTLIKQGIFLEHALVHGYHYGTSRQWVKQQLRAGIDVILEIDWQGAQQIKRHFPESISVFILPPSRAALESRLHERKQDSAEVIAKRLAAANEEISHFKEFDYLIINDQFDTALHDLQAIIRASRLRESRQAAQYQLTADQFK